MICRCFNLWAVGWSEVPLQLFVLRQTDKALRLGLLLLELLGDCLQLLWVQLGIQGPHLRCKNRIIFLKSSNHSSRLNFKLLKLRCRRHLFFQIHPG